jgi:hypothetical protein
VLRALTAVPNLKIIGCDLDEESGQRACNFVEHLGQVKGHNTSIEFEQLDLSDIDDIVNTLDKHEPDLVLQCATSLSNQLLDQIPDEMKKKLYREAGLGWLMPMHVRFPLNMGRAIEQAGHDTFFLNASLPDVVNPVLSTQGVTPVCGIGNVGMFASLLKKGVSCRYEVPVGDVSLYLVMAHGVGNFLFDMKHTRGGPYHMRVFVRDEDVTDDVDENERLRNDGWSEIPNVLDMSRKQVATRPLVAANGANIIRGLLHDTEELLHAPGPNGRVGGWPIRVSADGVEVLYPNDISDEEATRINRDGIAYDGVERIEGDGTIVYTDESYESVKNTIGYDCKRLRIGELEEREAEIYDIITNLDEKYEKFIYE